MVATGLRARREKHCCGQTSWPIARRSPLTTRHGKTSTIKQKIRFVFPQNICRIYENRWTTTLRKVERKLDRFSRGSSQWFIALLPGRVCRVGTTAIWEEKNDMFLEKGFYRAQARGSREKTNNFYACCNFLWSEPRSCDTCLSRYFCPIQYCSAGCVQRLAVFVVVFSQKKCTFLAWKT